MINNVLLSMKIRSLSFLNRGDGKQNYFSFEKMCVCFDEWFDDCEYPELIDGKWLFKVTINGQQKILDETGNEIK